MVSEDKQIFHCFGCGAGGDVFKFLMKIENIEFIDALKILAKKANVELDFEKNFRQQDQSRRATLIDILSLSAKYYNYILLNKSEGRVGLEYLLNRGIKKETIEKFKLGFSLNSWDSLFNFLKRKGFKEEDIFLAGLVIKNNNNGYYDRFRNRVMYPIFNLYNDVVAFGARILVDNKDEPKYINSPQTEIYDKSNILFGLNFAKEYIKKENCSVIVEGYMDCISSHQAGIQNVVATTGTALTNGHIKLLKRYSNTICFSFDQDLAGQNATERGVDIALTNDVDLRIITLKGTGFKDPDECVRANPETWKTAIDHSQPYLDFYFDKIKEEYNKIAEKATPKDVDRIVDPFLNKLSKIKSSIEKDLWLKKIMKDFDISREALEEKLKVHENSNKKFINESKVDAINIGKKDPNLGLQEFLISNVLNNKKLIPILVKLNLDIFTDQRIKSIAELLIKCYNEHCKDPIEFILSNSNNENRDYINYLLILGEKITSEQFFSSLDLKRELKHTIFKLCKNYINQELKDIRHKISLAEKANDKEQLLLLNQQLLSKVEELRKLEASQK